MVEGVFSFKEERKELTVKVTLEVGEGASLADIRGTGDSEPKPQGWCVPGVFEKKQASVAAAQ